MDYLEKLKAGIDYSLLPEHIQGGMKRYIERGIIPGDFLQAVIKNNLKESFFCADDVNAKRMRDIILFMHNEAPSQCWGDKAKLQAWARKGGLDGSFRQV